MKRQTTLNHLKLGKTAEVTKLFFNGTERRRFLDLGLIKGTKITPVLKSPSGDPTAYELRGSIVAIRKEDTEKIEVSHCEEYDSATTDSKKTKTSYKIGIAGNPNVGKSSIFNSLTGLNQHTGNWPRKNCE